MVNTKLGFVPAVLAIAGFVSFAANGPALAQDSIRIGTSSVGSVYYSLMVGASEIIHKHASINATVEPLGGSTANVYGLANRKIEFALTNAFAATSGFTGTFMFKKPVDVRLIAQGQLSLRYILTRKGSGVRTPMDLVGKTIIAKRRALPELALIMDALVKVYNLPEDKIKAVATTNSGEAMKALSAGSIDALIMPFSMRAPMIQKPMRDEVAEFIEISKEKRDAMLKLLPNAIYGVTVKKGTFEKQERDFYMFGMRTYLLAHSQVSDETAYKVTKALMDHNEDFSKYHKAARQYSIKNTLTNVVMPFHPGAVRYYQEKGVWTPALEAKQNSLLK